VEAKERKALALISGGLDSILAARVTLDQGIRVEGLHFLSLFCCRPSPSCPELQAARAAAELGIPLKVVNTNRSMLRVLKEPRHGYGKNMNPCIDCRIDMLKQARAYMEERGADFIVTGEVLGQRPMSQRKAAMRIVERESGLEGLLLRPLSAQWLEETIPEKEGWVDRTRLLNIRGRSRKQQLEMAKQMGLSEYASPAGGCLLTFPEFGQKARDLVDHAEEPTLNDWHLLKMGRHFRLDEKTKLVVGRSRSDNRKIASFATRGDLLLRCLDIPGPTALFRGEPSERNRRLAARILLRYSRARDRSTAPVALFRKGAPEPEETMDAVPIDPVELKPYKIIREKTRGAGPGE
jgi:tRNA U34 2-thiouridine synthase MnmA/TrmU